MIDGGAVATLRADKPATVVAATRMTTTGEQCGPGRNEGSGGGVEEVRDGGCL